jgi:hypothetical protein
MEDHHSCYIQKLTKNTMTCMKHEHREREKKRNTYCCCKKVALNAPEGVVLQQLYMSISHTNHQRLTSTFL